jgi:predicted ATPase
VSAGSALGRWPTSIVGRTAEIEELRRLVERPGLVTVTGPVGAGKSRLAREALPDAVVVPAASLAGASAFSDAIAEALGASGASDSLAAAIESLRRSPRTVIVDDADRLIALEVLGALADAIVESAIVITSRSRTHHPSERVLELAPLSLPHDGADGDAVALLSSLAERERGRPFEAFELDDVRALARELDGLPLAIELAAARLRVLAPRSIRHRLSSRFEVLQRPRRSTPPARHDAIEAALDWAWSGLEPWEQRALVQCTVFAAPFTAEAAESVLVLGDGAPSTLDALTALRDRSLLRSTPGAEVRLSVLAAVRDHAIARAPDSLAPIERRHAEWFVARAEAWVDANDRSSLRAERAEGLAVLARLRDVRATSADRAELALRAAIALAPVLIAQGPTAEIAALVDPVLAVTARSGADARLQGRALHARGLLRVHLRDLGAARADLEAARHLASKFGDSALEVRAIVGLAELEVACGDRPAAVRALSSIAPAHIDDAEVAIVRAELASDAAEALADAARAERAFPARSLRVRARFASERAPALEAAVRAARSEGDRGLEAELLLELGAHEPAALGEALRAADSLGDARLAERCRRAIESGRAPERRIAASPSGHWFELDERVDLSRRRSLRLVLARLLDERARGDASVAWDALLEAGWPNERVGAEAGQHRVRVAILTLRKLGLGRHLQTTEEGYRLDPTVPIELCDR